MCVLVFNNSKALCVLYIKQASSFIKAEIFVISLLQISVELYYFTMASITCLLPTVWSKANPVLTEWSCFKCHCKYLLSDGRNLLWSWDGLQETLD